MRSSRFLVFLMLSIILMGIISVRYAVIMLTPSPISDRASLSVPHLERGAILDRGGRVLAIQTRLDTVKAWLPYIDNPGETSKLLGGILGIADSEIFNKISNPSNKSVYIKRKITPTESAKITELKQEGKLKGISFDRDFGRNYPERELASHLIGFMGVDNTGLEGIEWAFNNELSPDDWGPSTFYGKQIYLTIDQDYQYLVESIAKQAFTDHKPQSATILVMDAKTAEVLAYASYPTFDPNHFQKYSQSERQNRPITESYEPGSVFKIFTLAAFLELGAMTEHTLFPCKGFYEKITPFETIRIKDLGVHGMVDLEKIIITSCNSGPAYASDLVSDEDFYRMIRAFGFGRKIGVPLPGETNGIFQDYRYWSARTKPTLAIGQEIAVSAMQMITAATVFANEGVLLKPQLVSKITQYNGQLIKQYEREPVTEIISPKNAKLILSAMEKVTLPGGTGWRANIPDLRMAVKTGTAQKADPLEKKYSETEFISSSLAILPADNPQLIIYIMLNAPEGETYGGRIVAPLIKKTAQALVPLMGIPVGKNQVIHHSAQMKLTKPETLHPSSIMPDFFGKSKRQVVPFFQNANVKLHAMGEGWVKNQSPPAGTQIESGMSIFLEFE